MEDRIALTLQSLLIFPFLFLFGLRVPLGLVVFIDTFVMVVVVWNEDGFSDDFWNAKEKTSKWSNVCSVVPRRLKFWLCSNPDGLNRSRFVLLCDSDHSYQLESTNLYESHCHHYFCSRFIFVPSDEMNKYQKKTQIWDQNLFVY